MCYRIWVIIYMYYILVGIVYFTIIIHLSGTNLKYKINHEDHYRVNARGRRDFKGIQCFQGTYNSPTITCLRRPFVDIQHRPYPR